VVCCHNKKRGCEKKMNKKSVVLEYEKSTKNTYRYSEKNTDNPPVIGTVYIQRYVVKNSPPDEIKITLEW